MTLNDIPREDLIAMIKERVWSTGGRKEFGGDVAYSLLVDEETALRDVIYRRAPLFKTKEEAILAAWKSHYAQQMPDLGVAPKNTRRDTGRG